MHGTAAAGLTQAQTSRFVTKFADLMVLVKISFPRQPKLQYLNEEKVLKVAVNERAAAIATFHQRKDGTVSNTYPIEVITPSIVIRRVRHA